MDLGNDKIQVNESVEYSSNDNLEKQCGKKPEHKPKKLSIFLKLAALISLGLAIVSAILRICFSKNRWAAEAFYRSVTRYLQAGMAALTSFLPFSLAETIVISLPLLIIVILFVSVYRFCKKDTYRLKRTVVCIFTVLCLVFSNFILNLSILYCRPSLSELSGIDDSDITADKLCAATIFSAYKLQSLVDGDSFGYDASGASGCPFGFDELDEKIEEAYARYAAKNEWISPYGAKAKIISLSDFMTYTHISGIHTQYTGEANINVNYPDYIVCATMAHEKAHQRGIAPEDEANLVAFFVLAQSNDPYLQYCGYMSVFQNLVNDCYRAAPEFYINNIASLIPDKVQGEFAAYSAFFDKYRESEISETVDSANNAYLKLNGEEHGTLSYDMVSGMAAEYILTVAEAELYTE